ncbi:DUF3168 domain-containing protein [Roseibacterium sp. SDUM158017]|uniref:DUF3168 domain-containing protein n=1 Tax=Roseicyclus salinarum TaxID=3036773 RepID=UPI0024150A6E|nr:DUF3168 domain-containing protein [Roseibacterium sp. SDUM158017]MDG4649803.1 DUF3168 domain-containing protein [Roseibacterium sp. SDUM158017]
MSYGSSASLQEAIFAALAADASVSALSGGAIYDAIPPGAVPSLYLSLGPERARHGADKTGDGAVHDFSVLVVSDGAGFGAAKALAVAVSDALDGSAPPLSRGRIVRLDFRRAQARRKGDTRQIELWFRAAIDLGNA